MLLAFALAWSGPARGARAVPAEVVSMLQTNVEVETLQDHTSTEHGMGPAHGAERVVRDAIEEGLRMHRTISPAGLAHGAFGAGDQEVYDATPPRGPGALGEAAAGADPGAAADGAGGEAAAGVVAPEYDSVSPPAIPADLGPVEVPQTNQFASGEEPTEEEVVAGHEGHGSGARPVFAKGYLCLAWLITCLVTGCVLQVCQERVLQRVPYTCLLFLTGFVMSAVTQLKAYGGSLWPTWFTSVEMWDTVDPHLLFYVFLPALIFAEAMRLNIKMVQDVSGQVLVLACPGVLFGALMIATFSHYAFPYDWSWPTSLVFGAILSATDPVAVVALFNTLGVSQRLTMLVSGESLVNDGTAIVMFSLFLKIMLGATVSSGGLVFFLANMTVTPILLGPSIAFCFLLVIARCSESCYHNDAMIQVVLTACCAFLCFFVAETQCSTSGVLTVVSAGCIFSYVAWPRFVSREVMRTVWEALEFIGNTVIFMLAGMLWGLRIMDRVDHLGFSDVGWLILLYLATTAARAIVVTVFWPFLNGCGAGQEISWQEGVVVVWSGLRGAVGLVLAICMDLQPKVDRRIGSQVMFHVGGIALLTICVNGTTTPWLLRRLGLTKMPEIEEQVTEHLHGLTGKHVKGRFDDIMDKHEDLRFVGVNVDMVRMLVPDIAGKIKTKEWSTIDADVKLQVYRETFLRAVQQHYWSAIEGGVIPRTSRVARVLLYSADVGMSDSKEPLHDWEVLAENLSDHQYFPRMNRICETWPLTLVPPLQQLFPSSMTIMMWRVYASVSFVEAHKSVQEDLRTIFGPDFVFGEQVQQELARESDAQCEQALELQRSLPAEAVEVGKSRMLSGRLLQLQLERVLKLRSDGMLNDKSATGISQRIYESRREVAGVRNHAKA